MLDQDQFLCYLVALRDREVSCKNTNSTRTARDKGGGTDVRGSEGQVRHGTLLSLSGFGKAWSAQVLVLDGSVNGVYSVTAAMYRGRTNLDVIIEGAAVVVQLDEADTSCVGRWWLSSEGVACPRA